MLMRPAAASGVLFDYACIPDIGTLVSALDDSILCGMCMLHGLPSVADYQVDNGWGLRLLCPGNTHMRMGTGNCLI